MRYDSKSCVKAGRSPAGAAARAPNIYAVQKQNFGELTATTLEVIYSLRAADVPLQGIRFGPACLLH